MNIERIDVLFENIYIKKRVYGDCDKYTSCGLKERIIRVFCKTKIKLFSYQYHYFSSICLETQFDISTNAMGAIVCSIVAYSLGAPVLHS